MAEQLTRLPPDSRDAYVILCGGLHREGDTYSPSTYIDADQYGMLGGMMRVIAAAELYLGGHVETFVFSTGISAKQRAINGQDVPEAKIYADTFWELIEGRRLANPQAYGDLAPPKIILEDRFSANTADNIRRVAQLAEQSGWRDIALLSSRYHLGRVAALFALIQAETGTDIHPTFVSAEEMVQELRPGVYDQEIATAYASESAALREHNEANGLRDMKLGRYVLSEFQLHQSGIDS